MWYFAYGSNMDQAAMLQRCPASKPLGIGRLMRHRFIIFEEGYASIGCQPCTRSVRSGEDERAGRWSGSEKTECGIHTFMKKK